MTDFNRKRLHKTAEQPLKTKSVQRTHEADSQPEHPDNFQSNIVRMQSVIGNKAVQRMLQGSTVQREGAGSGDETFSLREWPSKLQAVKRTKEQNITKVKDKAELNIPEMPALTLTKAQQSVIDQIKKNRAGLSPAMEKLKLVPYKKEKNAGYFYNGRDSTKMKPKDPAGMDEKRKKVMDAIRTEIGREGGWSAVNSYDDAVVTLGRGFTRSLLAKVMQTFFASDPEAKETFLDLGITWEGGTARIVNTATGGIEEGDNALRLIQLEPQILSVFVQMAESEEHGAKLMQAQEANTLGYQVPQSVIDNWKDMMAVRLVAHLIQWRSAKLWSDYAACNDDVTKILQVAKSGINKNRTDDKKGGAHIITAEQTGVLFSFAEGKAKEGLATPNPFELPEIVPDSLKDVILFDSGDGKKFYSTVRIGTTTLLDRTKPVAEQ